MSIWSNDPGAMSHTIVGYKTKDGKPVDFDFAATSVIKEVRKARSKSPKAERGIHTRALRGKKRANKRKRNFRAELIACGMRPNPNERKYHRKMKVYNNIVQLKARAVLLNRKGTFYEISRALEGLYDNPGADLVVEVNNEADAKENGLVKSAINEMDKALRKHNAPTVGSLLYYLTNKPANDLDKITTTKARANLSDTNSNSNTSLPYRISRKHIKYEARKILECQQQFHGKNVITDEFIEKIIGLMFDRKRSGNNERLVGQCQFISDEKRLQVADPRSERRRVLQDVNHIRIFSPGIDSKCLLLNERNDVLQAMSDVANHGEKYLSDNTLREVLGLDDEWYFKHENKSRNGLLCDRVQLVMAQFNRFGSEWNNLDLDEQCLIIEQAMWVKTESEIENFTAELMEKYELDKEHATEIAKSGSKLPSERSELGSTATEAIVQELENDVIPYSEAVKRCGWHHSDFREDDGLDRLPHYTEAVPSMAHIPGNPAGRTSVEKRARHISDRNHIVFGQIQRDVNALLEVYGKPDIVMVESSRWFCPTQADIDDEKSRNKWHERENSRITKLLEDIDRPVNGRNMERIKIWEYQRRIDPYSGKEIPLNEVFSMEIDHVIPVGDGGVDERTNKVLTTPENNRIKGNRAPYETWGSNTEKWKQIQDNVNNLPKRLRDRFQPDAIDDGDGDFLARSMHDNHNASKDLMAYFTCLFPKGRRHVFPFSSRLVAAVRKRFDLNSILYEINPHLEGDSKLKNRDDHRHNIIDAACGGLITPKIEAELKRRAKEIERNGGTINLDELVAECIPEPFPNFREKLKQLVQNTPIRHKPELKQAIPGVSTTGKLHKDSIHGKKWQKRKRLSDITFSDVFVKDNKIEGDFKFKSAGKIRDPKQRAELENLTRKWAKNVEKFASMTDKARNKKFQTEVMPQFTKRHPKQWRMCLLEKPASNYKAIKDCNDRITGYYKTDSNEYFAVYRMQDGKFKTAVVTRLQYNEGLDVLPHSDAVEIMRVRKNDMIAFGKGDEREFYFVRKMTAGKLTLQRDFDAGGYTIRNCSLKTLMENDARQIHMTAIEIIDEGSIFSE